MTEDAANRQKGEKAGITCISGTTNVVLSPEGHTHQSHAVRKYVEGTKEPTQLLDLLAAVGSDDIEPTRAVAGRQALYSDVWFNFFLLAPIC